MQGKISRAGTFHANKISKNFNTQASLKCSAMAASGIWLVQAAIITGPVTGMRQGQSIAGRLVIGSAMAKVGTEKRPLAQVNVSR
jgi:hypothetical protein